MKQDKKKRQKRNVAKLPKVSFYLFFAQKMAAMSHSLLTPENDNVPDGVVSVAYEQQTYYSTQAGFMNGEPCFLAKHLSEKECCEPVRRDPVQFPS